VSEITTSRENGRKRPKGYIEDWTPTKRIRAELDDVERVLEEYRDHLPLTVRQVFYRLVATRDYEKTERAYSRLGEHLVSARRSRRIPFHAIRDDGVVTRAPSWYADPADFWDYVGGQARGYRRDRQAGQRQRIELWCEAAGMMPQLGRVADDFSVPVYSAGGFVSLSGVRQIVDRALTRTVPTMILHVGDLDPSGASIFDSLAADAAAFMDADAYVGTQRIVARRVALTPEQVAAHELPTAPPKASDSRSKRWRGGTCQLEALPPDLLATIVADAISSELDSERYRAEIEREVVDRRALLRALPAGEAA